MKPDIHPDYVEATVRCSCGNTYVTHSTKSDLHVELCNECHPFFTGKQKLVDSGGRVERFQRRYGARKGKAKSAPTATPTATAGLGPVTTRPGPGRPDSPLHPCPCPRSMTGLPRSSRSSTRSRPTWPTPPSCPTPIGCAISPGVTRSWARSSAPGTS